MEAADFLSGNIRGRIELAQLFASRNYNTGAEVGTAEGNFAEVLCLANRNLKLYCIDPYQRYPGYLDMQALDLDKTYQKAVCKLSQYGAVIMRTTSLEAAQQFQDGSLDFVYIDANHSLPWVMDDLCAWYDKVRIGGIVSGHDYHVMNSRVHVKYAVDAFVKAYHIKGLRTLNDRYTSWYFEKQG